MLRIITKQHKTNFLTPSGLRCLASFPTVNVSAGCAHNCIYCYAKGYSVYPGDNSIEVYGNIVEKITEEIRRKRRKPAVVYFCPSCDPFQPIQEIQQITFEVMKILLEHNIGVQFVTKGKIPKEIFELFGKHNSKIAGQISLVAVDDGILRIIEPNAARAEERLAQLEKLIKIGVKMSVRCDPMIYGFTDADEQLRALFSAVARVGCRESAVSFLFLRYAIISNLKRNITDRNILNRILKPFSENVCLPIGLKNSMGMTLPLAVRKSSFERIRRTANDYGIEIHICGCKNSDITDGTCYITRSLSKEAQLF